MTLGGTSIGSDELDDLLVRLFDPGLDSVQANRIEELMAADASALSRYTEYVLLHANLAWRGGLEGTIKRMSDDSAAAPPKGEDLSSAMVMPAIRERDDEVADDAAEVPLNWPIRAMEPVRPAARRQSAKSRARARRWPWWGAAAAILLACGIAIVLLLSRSNSNSGSAIATIINTSNAQWDDVGGENQNTQLVKGQQLSLSAGWAELQFQGGASVVLRAPVSFSVDSPGSMTLASGTLSATVPGPAVGFTVTTADAVVKDLGTEFNVSYDKQSPTRVAVFKGRVEVATRTPTPAVTTLVAGDAASVSDGKISRLPKTAVAVVERFFPHIDAGGLPDAYADDDIGNPGIAGSATYSSSDEVWTLSGTGYDIWNDHDEFNAAFEPLPGDGTIVCCLTTPARSASSSMYTKAGIMVRESLDDACPFVAIVNTDGVGVQMIARDGAEQFVRIVGPYMSRLDAPVWFKLERKGDLVTGYCGKDGQTWRTIGNVTIKLPKSVSAGLVVNHANALGTAHFTHVAISR